MKPIFVRVNLVVLSTLLFIGLASTSLPVSAQTGKATPTAAATRSATAAPTQRVGDSSLVFPLDWPLPVPDGTMVDDALACDLETSYSPTSACDWAVLAVAFSERTQDKDELPEKALQAFRRAVAGNAALSFRKELMGGGYFSAKSLVKAPPFSSQPITQVYIELAWGGGIGVPTYNINYNVTISGAESSRPVVSGSLETKGETPVKRALTGTVAASLVQALGPALTDLLPIKRQFTLTPCTDNYPDWKVSLTFKDGTTLKLATNKSNFLFAGGPWQTEIDQQVYVQYSAEFLVALRKITDALGLPASETGAMFCAFDQDPLHQAFDVKSR